MNKEKFWRWGCVIFVGIFILLCGVIYNWQSISCRFPPTDPNVEVVISACYNPVLHSISPDGKYMVYSAEEKTWLHNLATDEEQPLSIAGGVWLSEIWLLQAADSTIYGRQFWIFDITDRSQVPLQWVQGMANTTFRQNDGTLIFSPDVLTWFRQADTVYYAPEGGLNIAVALSTDFKDQPEVNYVLATPRSHKNGGEEAIAAFLIENAIPYVEVKSRYYYYPPDPLLSPNERFIATGTQITTLKGELVVETEELYGVIHGWAYDNSGIYYQLSRLSNGPALMPLLRVGQTQPILKLKIPEEYLSPVTTP